MRAKTSGQPVTLTDADITNLIEGCQLEVLLRLKKKLKHFLFFILFWTFFWKFGLKTFHWMPIKMSKIAWLNSKLWSAVSVNCLKTHKVLFRGAFLLGEPQVTYDIQARPCWAHQSHLSRLDYWSKTQLIKVMWATGVGSSTWYRVHRFESWHLIKIDLKWHKMLRSLWRLGEWEQHNDKISCDHKS